VFDDPITGEHVVGLTAPYTNPDRAQVSMLTARPGAPFPPVSIEIEEPVAEALALIDEHGRLRWNKDTRP
jgi:hypothetical protein